MSSTGAACGGFGIEGLGMSEHLSNVAGRFMWAAYIGLLLQQSLDAFSHQAPWFIWLVKLLPLLIFLPGMLKGRLRTFIWLCFVCLGYFLILVQRIFAEPDSPLVISGLVGVVVLFIAAMMHVRWRARALRGDCADGEIKS